MNMVPYSGPERRRVQRVSGFAEAECRVGVHSRIRLIDISSSGVWLGCEVPMPLGAALRVRTVLAGAPFTAEVIVRRLGSVSGRGALTFGAMFVAMDETSRRTLDAFLRSATE